jgi:metal-responsive CopG/Arc/MetJ family transcriptional regulator
VHAHACMMSLVRTTVEIDDAQRAELLKLAAQRGEKGFSSVIREALELYLRQHRAKKQAVAQALELKGSFSDDEADALEASVRKLREGWR